MHWPIRVLAGLAAVPDRFTRAALLQLAILQHVRPDPALPALPVSPGGPASRARPHAGAPLRGQLWSWGHTRLPLLQKKYSVSKNSTPKEKRMTTALQVAVVILLLMLRVHANSG